MIIYGFLIIGIGIYVGWKTYYRPIIIDYKLSMWSCAGQAVLMFAYISLAMVLELIFNQWQLSVITTLNKFLWLLSRLIDAGLIAIFIPPVLSKAFEKFVEMYDLDLSKIYNENVIKVYYSSVVLANCIAYFIAIYPYITEPNIEIHAILSRIIMWVFGVVGTWKGMGFHCKGRIEQEISNIEESKCDMSLSDVIKYSTPFAITFLCMCFAFVLMSFSNDFLNKILERIYVTVLFFLFVMVVTAFGCMKISNPSEKVSNKRLSRAVKKINKREKISSHYQNLKYILSKSSEGKILVQILPREVVWKGKEKEINNIFGIKEVTPERSDYESIYESIKKELKKNSDDRKEFLRKSYKESRETLIESLLEEKRKGNN